MDETCGYFQNCLTINNPEITTEHIRQQSESLDSAIKPVLNDRQKKFDERRRAEEEKRKQEEERKKAEEAAKNAPPQDANQQPTCDNQQTSPPPSGEQQMEVDSEPQTN